MIFRSPWQLTIQLHLTVDYLAKLDKIDTPSNAYRMQHYLNMCDVFDHTFLKTEPPKIFIGNRDIF